jgi:hypothetical protein
LTDAPFWLSLTNSSSLVIAPPNELNVPGTYQFWIGPWAVTLDVGAPCNANSLQGLREQGHVAVYVDDVIVLAVAFELDDKQHSWEKVCGAIERAYIHNAPIFVTYDEHRMKIVIKPQDKNDKGTYLILIELYIKSTKHFH